MLHGHIYQKPYIRDCFPERIETPDMLWKSACSIESPERTPSQDVSQTTTKGSVLVMEVRDGGRRWWIHRQILAANVASVEAQRRRMMR